MKFYDTFIIYCSPNCWIILCVSDFIRPVCLPKENIHNYATKDLILHTAGWGVSNKSPNILGLFGLNSKFSPIKFHVEVPYIPLEVSYLLSTFYIIGFFVSTAILVNCIDQIIVQSTFHLHTSRHSIVETAGDN